MLMNVAKAMLIEVNVTAFWLPPADRIYRVASERILKLAMKDNSNKFKYQVL